MRRGLSANLLSFSAETSSARWHAGWASQTLCTLAARYAGAWRTIRTWCIISATRRNAGSMSKARGRSQPACAAFRMDPGMNHPRRQETAPNPPPSIAKPAGGKRKVSDRNRGGREQVGQPGSDDDDGASAPEQRPEPAQCIGRHRPHTCGKASSGGVSAARLRGCPG